MKQLFSGFPVLGERIEEILFQAGIEFESWSGVAFTIDVSIADFARAQKLVRSRTLSR